MSVLVVLGTIVSSTAAAALVTVWFNRNKTASETDVNHATAERARIDSAMLVAQNALAQSTSAQTRLDRQEEDIREFRRQLFPHQRWDALAHAEALKSNPDFPAPPDLFI